MKILKIRIHNLNSLQLTTEIDFNQSPISDTGLFAITGDTGSGKTTILDAITLALYGRIHRNKEVKDVLSYGEAECWAEVEFSSKNEIYFSKWGLKRARGKADGKFQAPVRNLSHFDKKTQEFIPIAAKSREVDKEMERITGLDYNRFTRSVLLSQGDFAAFLNASEKDRSDLLERITGTEIYSQISMAAYQKYKEENEKLQQFQLQQEALQLLPKEAVLELKENKKELETKSKTLQKSIESHHSNSNWLQQVSKLSKKQAELAERKTQLRIETEASKTNFALLEKHEQTIPFQSLLSKWQDNKAAFSNLSIEIEANSSNILVLEKTEKSSKEAFAVQEISLKKIKKESLEFNKILTQVQKLDIAIEEKQSPFENLKKNVEVSQKEQAILTKEIASKQNSLSEKKKEVELLTDWLLTHNKLSHYAGLAPRIKHEKEELRLVFIEQRALQKQVKELEEKIAIAAETKEKAEKSCLELKSSSNQLLQDFHALAPENFVLTRTELLQKINEEIEELDDESKNLQQLKTLASDYVNLLYRYSEGQERLEHLEQEEVMLGKEILTSREQLDKLSEELLYKKTIVDREKLIAVYERDRENLEEGKPCPLCQSTIHPFREKPVTPFTNRAQEEYEEALAQKEIYQEKHLKLIRYFAELIPQIQHLKGDEKQKIEGHLDSNLQQINGIEEKMAAFAPLIKAEHYEITKETLLLQKINTFESDICNKKKAREELIQIDKKLESQEEKTTQLTKDLQEADFQWRSLSEQKKQYNTQLDALNNKFQTNTKSLNKQLRKLGYTFESIELAKAMFEELDQKGEEFSLKEKSSTTLRQEIALQEQALKSQEKQYEKEQKELDKLLEKLQKTQAVLEKIQADRKLLFGEKEVEQERQKQSLLLQTNENALEQKRQAMDSAFLAFKTQTAQLKEQQRQHKKIKEGILATELDLTSKIATSVFASIGELQSATLEPNLLEKIQNKRKNLEKQSIELEQAIRENEKEQTSLRQAGKQKTELSLEEIQIQLLEAEQIFQSIQQELGGIKVKLDQDKNRKKEAKNLLLEIEKQRLELNRWSKLNDIIGQADGQKFRKFAQGLTLQNLIVYANQHLKQLHGRYRISKSPNQDLSLEIIDAFQADNRRSMQTLSGGESFLISLALALALSDMAGSNTNIQSLFIDEGFGTLDEQTLDMAISTLENLQAQGKTIGVISHVKELKERIGTQIRVLKSGSGRSTIEIV